MWLNERTQYLAAGSLFASALIALIEEREKIRIQRALIIAASERPAAAPPAMTAVFVATCVSITHLLDVAKSQLGSEPKQTGQTASHIPERMT